MIASLQAVGLSQYEARVYVALLRNGTQNGNELARSSGVPSSKVYAMLGKLADEGIVHATTGGTADAFAPSRRTSSSSACGAGSTTRSTCWLTKLPRLRRPEEAAPLLGVTGLAGVLETARAIIGAAATAIHASCWSADVEALRETFAAADERGVAVWGMLYGPAEPPAGTWLRHSYEDIVEHRVGGRMLTLVADGADVLVARLPLDGEATAVRTRSPVLTMIVDEYLHHDFVLQRAQINIGFDQWRTAGGRPIPACAPPSSAMRSPPIVRRRRAADRRPSPPVTSGQPPTRISLRLTNSSAPKRPSSRPKPERLTPPNGSSAASAPTTLTNTMPASIWSATRSAWSESVVNRYEPSPYGVSFASLDGLVLGADAVDDRDRAEELLAVRVVVGRDVGQHGAGEEVALALAAGDERRAAGDGALQLVLEPVGRGRRGERAHRRVGRGRIARLDGGDGGRQLVDERLVEVVGDDEALGRVAGLAGVLEARRDGRLDDVVEVVGAEQDERIGAAQLEHDLLQVAAGDLGDGRAGALRAGHRHALHARVGDHVGDLLVAGVDVGVRALGEAGVVVELLDRGGRLGALRRVLEQHRVADRRGSGRRSARPGSRGSSTA